MKDSIRRKLEKLDERFEEVGRLLSDAGVISKQNQFRELSMEYSRLEDLVGRYRRFLALHLAFPDMDVVPCKLVDEMWHRHILDPAA